MRKEYSKPELMDLNENAGFGDTYCRTGSGNSVCQVGNAAGQICGMGNGGLAT
jgi:hypothetical protein